MIVEQTVEIPANRRLVIDVPREVPVGRTVLTFTPAADHCTDTKTEDCPMCAKYRDPETGELRFNAETEAAFKQGDAMMTGEKPAKWYGSLDEMMVDLDKDN